MRRRFKQLSRPVRHGVAYLALRGLVGVLRIMPLRLSMAIGSACGTLIGRIAFRENARMAAQLGAALNTPPSPSACWRDLGRRFVEFACASRLADRVEITPAAKAQFAMARARGRGVLVATLHLGNWELMAAALATQGIDFTAVGARPKASPLHRWLTSTRSALGVVVLSPGGGARSAASHLGEGGTVAFFVDQSTGERSRSIQFFHHTAPTPTTYERLLQLTGATPLLVWTARDADGIHRVHAENLPRDTETNLPNSGAGHPSNPPILPLDWLTARAETLIRTYPTQWIWLHRRWGKHSTGA